MFNHFGLSTFAPIAICCLLILIGRYQVNKRLRSIREKMNRVKQFLADLKSYVDSGGANGEAYLRMVHQSALVQRDIGSYGIAAYKPPGASSFITSYQLIVNHLSELERWIQNDDAFHSLKPGRRIASAIQEGLVRYLGVVEESELYLQRIRRKPLLLLREGIAWLFALPFGVFSFLGVTGENTSDIVSQSGIIRFVAGLVAIIGLVGSVVTIITGWTTFTAIVEKWF